MISDRPADDRAGAAAGSVRDGFGRRIRYLRVSVTDACNFRCRYCMPEDAVFRPPAEILQDDELLRFAGLFASLGFEKFRLTGGEPTIRAGIVDLVRLLSALPSTPEVALTTNGSRLRDLARPLSQAGLRRVNVRFDTLNPTKFNWMSLHGRLERVWDGIRAAEDEGIAIKLNAVVVRGFNDREDAVELARLTLSRDWQVRFLEMMPMGRLSPFHQSNVVTEHELRSTIEGALGWLGPERGGQLEGEARVYRLPGARGTIGFISSVSAPFCRGCDRARLTADGRLRLCLLRENETNLMAPLRAGATDAELAALISGALSKKPREHGLGEGVIPLNRLMSEIGG
jgi:cyclic pyranopterin phosphate synthase